MSDNNKDNIEEMINKAAMELPDEVKEMLLKKAMQSLGSSLELVPILRLGAKYAPCKVSEIPVEALKEGLEDNGVFSELVRLNMVHQIETAQIAIAGSMTEDEDKPQFIIVVTEESGIAINSFDKRITQSRIAELIDYLIIQGLESHDMIRRVLHSQNFVLTDGLKIHAYGPGCEVKVGQDASYSVNLTAPKDVFAMMSSDIPPELKEVLEESKQLGDALECENGGEPGCECSACQLKDIAGGEVAKSEGNVH